MSARSGEIDTVRPGRKRGRSRLARWANTASRLVPLHTSDWLGAWTENDISDGAVATSSSLNSAINRG